MKLSFKIISILLVMMLCFTSIVSCNNQPTAVTSSTTTSVESTAPTAQPKVDVSIELVFLPTTLAENQSSNVIAKYMEDKFNVNLKFIPSDAEKIRLHLSTGQAGDIISIPPWLGDLSGMMEEGVKEKVFVDISALVDKEPARYPTFAKIFKEPLYKYMNTYYTGVDQIYGMFALDYTRNVAGAPFYNKKIMDELGLQMPKTVDEFVTYLRAVKAKKPDIIPFFFRNDLGSWLGATGGDTDLVFFQTYGLKSNSIVQDKDGKWYDTSMDTANKEAWKRLAGMYKEGLIDKEIFTKKNDLFMASDWGPGKIAVVMSQMPGGQPIPSYPFDVIKEANPTIDPKTLLDYVVFQPDPLTGPAGFGKTTAVAKSVPFGSFVTSTCKNPDRALDILNWIMSDEGQTVLNYGIKGVHYDSLDDKGRVVGFNQTKFKEDNMVWGQGGLSFGFLLLSGSATRYLPDRYGWTDCVMNKDNLAEGVSSTLPADLLAYCQNMYTKWQKDYFVELPLYYNTIAFSDEYKAILKKLREVKLKYFVGFIFGTYDVDKDWDKFVKEVVDAGGVKYATEYGRLLEIEKAKFDALSK